MKMMRGYEIQYSISEGVARVLKGEVAAALAERGKGTKRGVRFDVRSKSRHSDHHGEGERKEGKEQHHHPTKVKPGFCAGCGKALNEDGTF